MRFKIIKNQHDLQNHQNPAQSRKSSKPSLIIKSQHHLPKSSKTSIIFKTINIYRDSQSTKIQQNHQNSASYSKPSISSITRQISKTQHNHQNSASFPKPSKTSINFKTFKIKFSVIFKIIKNQHHLQSQQNPA